MNVYVLSALFLVWSAFFSVENEAKAQTFIHYTPYIILNNYIDKQGDQIQVSGFMFSPNESVNITFYNLPIPNKTIVADSKGNFAMNFLLGNIPSDKYTISVVGSISDIKTSATLFVTGYYPVAVPSSYYVLPDGEVSFSGSKFAPNEKIYVQVQGQVLSTIQADQFGSFLTDSFSIPQKSSRGLTYRFTGQTSKISIYVTLTAYIPNPWLKLSSYYSGAGSSLTITGYGFGVREPVSFIFDDNYIGSAVSDQNGTVTISTLVPENGSSKVCRFISPYYGCGISQMKVVSATGQSTKAKAQATFTQAY